MALKLHDRVKMIANEAPAKVGMTGTIVSGPYYGNTWEVCFDVPIVEGTLTHQYLTIRGSKMELESKSLAQSSNEFTEGDELELAVDFTPGTRTYPAGSKVVFLSYGEYGRNKNRSFIKVPGGTSGSYIDTNKLKYPEELFPFKEKQLTREQIDHLWEVTLAVGRFSDRGML